MTDDPNLLAEALLWIYPRIPRQQYRPGPYRYPWDKDDCLAGLCRDAVYGAGEGCRAAIEAMATGKWPPLSAASRFYLKESCAAALRRHRLAVPSKGIRSEQVFRHALSPAIRQALEKALVADWRSIELEDWADEHFEYDESDPHDPDWE